MLSASSRIIQDNHLPRHIAIIMDGNGRWAEGRGLPRLDGHRTGVKNVRALVEYLIEYQIKYVTVYSFSTENWNRPPDEVAGLLRILEESIDKETIEFHKRGIKLSHIGRLERLLPELQQTIKQAVELTKNNTVLTLSFAFNYGGRSEILDAVQRLIAEGVPPQDIDDKMFSRYLYTSDLPDVDLVIRTGGELRISNFLIWQSAYSEYYFTPVLWPDFDKKEFEKALDSYAQRNRRFGGL